ncbi:MAG: DUF4932 domain-containing protein [Planctomycetes bacterium]|nr:DUF4932 domain-containing protein [Planctomycetota bacterium]
MNPTTLLSSLALLGSLVAQDGRPALIARVDPRVELLGIVFRLAENPEYSDARVPGYAADADSYFGGFREHPVVVLARELRGSSGISYDAVMSFAVHLDGVTPPAFRVPLDPRPEALEARWSAADAARFLAALGDFVATSRFDRFLAEHTELYRDTAARMQAVLDAHARLDWFDRFFGARPAARFELSLALLNGGACYGARVRLPDGTEELHCILGVWMTDGDGGPRFTRDVLPTVVHEFCHSYCNPIVDAHWEAMAPFATTIWPAVADRMRAQAYSTPRTMMCETLVRATVLRYRADVDGSAAALLQLAEEVGRGFSWVGAVAQRLAVYERERERYATLDAFVPELVDCLDDHLPGLKERLANTPHVVSTEPVDSSRDVDPATDRIVVTFDRPMRDGSWSVVGGGPRFPELIGEPSYDDARRVLTIRVRLAPERAYELSLNSERFQGFRSAEGVPLEPVRLTFRTGAAR